MDERLERENAEYLENLKSLVSARTEQLRQAATRNSDLFEFLKQLQTMQSLEQVHDAVRVLVEKLKKEAGTAPHFGGNPGDPVPEVDPDELRKVWEMNRDLQARYPGKQVATGRGVFERALKPGADIDALGFRAAMLSLLMHATPDLLTPWTRDGRINDVVFVATAKIPLKWMAPGVVTHGLPFDVEEFLQLCTTGQ